MHTVVLALLLAGVLSFLFRPVRFGIRGLLQRSRASVLFVPLLLTAVFAGAAAAAGAASLALAAAVLVYTGIPALCAFLQGPGAVKRPSAWDAAIILLLWLPLEFAAGAALVPVRAQGFLHSVAYGIAILLALVIFTGYRALEGMKYNLPRSARDLRNPLAGFALTAPVLILLGIAIGFIPPAHAAAAGPARAALIFAIIFVGTALPEEILFRSLIQNALERRIAGRWLPLVAASVIFGCAHLNNGPPQVLPNWRYMILATIAGFAYGKVFQASSTVLASALFHALVDATKHIFF